MQVPPTSELTLGCVCVDKSTPGKTVWKMTVDERLLNPAGLMQGGFLAAFCDTAMGSATITQMQGKKVFSANAELKISFIRPVKPNDELYCTARVIHPGSRVMFVEAEVTCQDKLVAKASSTYIITERS
jgi:uncharacterized protein (TIGR00369 family)